MDARALMDDGAAEGERLGVVRLEDGGRFDLNVLAEGIARFVAEYVAPLRAQVEVLEARPQLRYEGTHEIGKLYTPGAFVTFDGCLWCCIEETRNRPGNGDRCWRLAVKRGADGKWWTPPATSRAATQ